MVKKSHYCTKHKIAQLIRFGYYITCGSRAKSSDYIHRVIGLHYKSAPRRFFDMVNYDATFAPGICPIA